MMMMEPKPVDLYEFLVESELQQYYNSIKNELKITMVSHLKYASDEDLKQVGLSKPEIRRLRKFYEKFYPHGYLSKIKRLLQTPVVKKEDGTFTNPTTSPETIKVSTTTKIPSNKHIIPADSICVNKQLGTGEFGIVQQGVWTNGTERIQVAIKCLCRERMQSNPMEFLKEAAIMHSIEHENIVRLYGVVLDTDSLMLVTELAHLRSLLECLKDPGLRVSFLTVPTLCEFAQQICNGMMYLENKRLIHRDLAARNILVFSKNKVKISDFGLSRALGVGKDYYQTNFNVNLKLPIAWCAPECINFLRFTNASDVWAYGVCLWEMFSYGFQPWAALTGHQILEAIDEPNYQRLEAPECCPKEYYSLMLKCWQHDPIKRPKFSEIYEMLPDMKPEQLKTILGCSESKKDHLLYRQNEIISVLDKTTNSPYWKGVLNSGKTGIFNPANTVTYLGSLPSSTNRDSFSRTSDRSSKRKLRTEMISMPQNDLKHTGHVGLDGAYFGDVAFLSNAQNYNHVPRQIVTPYKPSEDIEQTPLLLPPTPTSPDSLQTASGYFPDLSTNHSFVNQNESHVNVGSASDAFSSAFNFPNHQTSIGFSSSNPFANHDNAHNLSRQNVSQSGAFTNTNIDDDGFQKDQQRHKNISWPDVPTSESPHEYHEISDDEIGTDKVFDLGPSLLDEMDFMFRSMSTTSDQEPKSPEIDTTNKKNEITELASKLQRKNSSNHGVSSSLGTMTSKSKKKGGTVKPISVKDEKILNQAIDFANEITARSMTDLVSETPTTQSPKRKFSFRFPNLTHHSSMDKDNHSVSTGNGTMIGTNTLTNSAKNRNFSDELKNTPDLQNSISEESREAYNNLVEKPSQGMGRYDYEKTKLEHLGNLKDVKIISATLPRHSIQLQNETFSKTLSMKKAKDIALTLPPNSAQRPTTLPYRSSSSISSASPTTKSPEIDLNPLRILRDKNYPIVRSRIKVCAAPIDDEIDRSIAQDVDGACESPSYLTNAEYTFSEKDVNIHRGIQKQIATKEIENLNPIPLPPRDRSKVMQTNVKRHIRKHPLIIPASGLQRTLNKVTSPTDTKSTGFTATSDLIKHTNQSILFAHPEKCVSVPKLKNFDHPYMNQEDVNVSRNKNNFFTKHFLEQNFPDTGDRTYENLETLRYQMQDCTDSASLHFESILEDDMNKIGEMSSPDVANGFMFQIQKDHYEKPNVSQLDGETDEIRNLDIERRKMEFSQKHPKYLQPNNELANNVLFNKVKESVESVFRADDSLNRIRPASTVSRSREEFSNINDKPNENDELLEQKLKNSNSVSCEDLLEFSDSKPKGRERGVESDEVRIMTKVLGTVASPEQCIEALNFIDWDVHKAIKLIMLRKTLSSCNLTLEECVDALQKYEWDLQTTTLKLKTL